MQPTELYREVIITDIKEEISGVKTYTLTPADNSPIRYQAGQFLTFVFNHHHKEERRSFSISSTPEDGEPLTITVKRLDNGAYSRLLVDRAIVGDKLYTTGAAGLFTILDNIAEYEQVFFFAAGIGITPVFSIIKSLLANHSPKVVLIYSNRNADEVVFYKELVAMQDQYPGRFKIEFLYSNSFNLGRARLSKWLLPTLLDEYAATTNDKMLFYTCGPYAYMRMVILGLEEQGIDNSCIKRENFNTNERPANHLLPPDKETRIATINYKHASHTVMVPYPDSILQAAKKQGIILPYSCETGRCGSCVAICAKGKVWMSYNEVLTESDLANGRVLTCVGHPIGGDITIEL